MIINDVFVIMPFSEQTLILPGGEPREYPEDHFDNLYDIIQEAVEEYRDGIQVNRADEKKSGNILAHVVRRVEEADLVIAVLTAKNANVFWELGIRHALKKGTMMLLAERDEVPFDLSGYFSHVYSTGNNSGIKALRQFICDRLGEYEQEDIEDSPVIDILDRAEHDQFRAWNVIEARRAALVLQGLIQEHDALRDQLLAALKIAKELYDDERSELDEIEFPVHMLSGFARSRPLVGIHNDAYTDALNLIEVYQGAADRWNEHVLALRSGAMEESARRESARDLQALIATIQMPANLFTYDVAGALAHVTTNKDSWSIPWGNSMDIEIGETIQVDELFALDQKTREIIATVWPTVAKFESDLGVEEYIPSPFPITFSTDAKAAEENEPNETEG